MTKREKTAKVGRRYRFGALILAALVFVVCLPLAAFAAYSVLNNDRIYNNQFIDGINFAKRNKVEAAALLTDRAGAYTGGEIQLQYQGDAEKIFVLKPADIGLHYDITGTVNQLWLVGRRESMWQSFAEQAKSIFIDSHHPMVYTYNDEALKEKVKSWAKEIDQPEKDYALHYQGGKFVLDSERKPGQRIDQAEIIITLKSHFNFFNSDRISFAAKNYQPQVLPEKADIRLKEANQILNLGELLLEFEGKSFALDVDAIGGLIRSRTKDDDLEFYFDDARLNKFMDTVAAAIDVEPGNAKLKIENDKAVVFQISQTGKKLKKDESKAAAIGALLARLDQQAVIAKPQKVALVVDVKKPEISEGDVGNLGIVELIGTGTTDFTGSPSNRIHNIRTGAAALNGVLIKPGEVFSTLGRLGQISGETGYLQELVIKENQTIPEYGGGLCQVSTTLFRAAMNAGMKITNRQNHKYRVGYYEPPVGMDATIYDPAPDFKFENNFTSHVLVQATVEKNKIRFDLYGTKDGRVAEVGQPATWDPVDPGPAVEVETDTLPAGERKQIEKPHAGISAKFHYKVHRNGEVLQETDFYSKYVPWPEKWLVGKQPAPAPETPPAAP